MLGDRVAAVVGNKIILESSVEEQVSVFLSSSSKKDVVVLRKSVLDYLIEQEVLIYFAEKDSLLSVDGEQVSLIVGERLDFFKNQLGSVAALEQYFGTSFSEIRDILKKEAEGVFLADLFKRKLLSFISA